MGQNPFTRIDVFNAQVVCIIKRIFDELVKCVSNVVDCSGVLFIELAFEGQHQFLEPLEIYDGLQSVYDMVVIDGLRVLFEFCGDDFEVYGQA